MKALVELLLVVGFMALWMVAIGVAQLHQRSVDRRRERLRLHLTQLAAERRIQQTTQDAVRRMLEAARDASQRNDRQ